MTTNNKEIEKILTSKDEIDFEKITPVDASPLTEPIKSKDGSVDTIEEEEAPEEVKNDSPQGAIDQEEGELFDAPEQQINEDYDFENGEEEEFELPNDHAKQAADTVLGMTDNFLEIGAGFFIKVKTYPDFYQFEEIIQVIDEHNDKCVRKLKLSKEDKALLKPLLVEVLKKKAKKLTPEQQLLGAIISIIVKKAQIIVEIRKENEILIERILEIVREEKMAMEQDDSMDNAGFEDQKEPSFPIAEEDNDLANSQMEILETV